MKSTHRYIKAANTIKDAGAYIRDENLFSFVFVKYFYLMENSENWKIALAEGLERKKKNIFFWDSSGFYAFVLSFRIDKESFFNE
jgi:hypothetical protein